MYSNVSNLRFTVDIEKHPSVYVVRSSHINIFNCNAYSTGANSNPTLLVGSTYCNIHDNIFETTFTGYMNMSWKRAGILLGESHYNNIYRNDVTIKDSNGIYLTTYGWEKSNYNNIYNNTIRSSAISEETGLPNPSAWAYGIHLIMATQRPDANVIPGQIKNNMTYKACGHADKVLSQIVIDSTDASEIPPDIPGRFITDTGEEFQAIMLSEEWYRRS